MGIFEFILSLVAMIIVGFWGTIIVCDRCGLIDNADDKNNKKSEAKKKADEIIVEKIVK